VAVLALAGSAYWLHGGAHFSEVMGELKKVAQWAAGVNPALYVAALAVLPYVGVPSSFLYPVASNAYGIGMGLAWSALGIALNITLGYLIGTRWLRKPLTGWLERRGHHLPEVPRGEEGKLVALTRIIPGPPLIVQNLLLAMAGVPFAKYFFYSLPITLAFAAGIVLTSGALFEGKSRLVVAGVCAIVALSLLAHVVNAIYQARRKKNPPAP
jgi:uncharacterized membrane protein YdjX (TVP38/TMEM64 family)